MSHPTDVAQKRVLIVDDSKFVRTTFKHIIKGSFAVREEADGEAAWRAIQDDRSIVMVFSDLDMPKLDGYGLIERIRKSGTARIRDLPVIVFSGSQSDEAAERARKAGANDFISKSADAPEVLSRILSRLGIAAPQAPARQKPGFINEGRKHYSNARERGTPLSVMALRVENYAEVVEKISKDVAEQVLARIAKAISAMFPGESIVGRTAETAFVLITPRAGASEMAASARRLQEQIENAQLRHGAYVLKIRACSGVASPSMDTANSIEELIRLALQRALPADPAMLDLTPSERAVLRQISGLVADGSAKVLDMRSLTGSWSMLHQDAYKGGYLGLVKKGFIAPSANGDAFSITSNGMKALRAIR